MPTNPEVWLALGDSEMEGQGDIAELPANYPPLNGKLWMMRTPGAWAQLSEPCANGVIQKSGPGGLFGWYLQRRSPSKQIAIINCAVGGWHSAQQRKIALDVPAGFTKTVYYTALDRIQSALSLPGAVFKGFIIYDGANDAIQYGQSGAIWLSDWTSTLAAYRADIGGAALTAPVIYTQLPPTSAPSVSQGWWDAIRADQAAWQATDRVMLTVDDSGPWRDTSIHLNTAGNDILAQRYASLV